MGNYILNKIPYKKLKNTSYELYYSIILTKYLISWDRDNLIENKSKINYKI